MISVGEAIFYFEYYDHGRTWDKPKEIFKNPLILWCCGKIFEDSGDFIAVITAGTKGRIPSSQPAYEIIYKPAIIKQELVKVVD